MHSVFLLEKACNKNLDADGDEDHAAEDAGLAGQLRSHLLADGKSRKSNRKSNRGDEASGDGRLGEIIVGDGKAYGQRVNGCGDALQ